MKKLLAVIAAGCLSTLALAQQDPQFSQNMYNRLYVNPAYAGSLQTERLFLRFQKQHSNENGTGLGLHLSQKIAELFGAVIHYKFADNQHCFTINFHNAATE